MNVLNHQRVQEFTHQYHLEGLSEPCIIAIIEGYVGYSTKKANQFLNFRKQIDQQLLNHNVITDNHYTSWFAQGLQSKQQMQAFIIQFSVFSNQFLVAQLHKMINADTLESMRSSKEILANEIGVTFNTAKNTGNGNRIEQSIGGSVEGGTFHFNAGHFEWLLKTAKEIGLTFKQLGRREFGTQSTLFYCDELLRIYANNNYQISQAASFAVENWAAAGFWKELIQGIKNFNKMNHTDLSSGFFTWHDRIEDQHAAHTQEELETLYFHCDIDEEQFILYGNQMLDGVSSFWDGLEKQRIIYS